MTRGRQRQRKAHQSTKDRGPEESGPLPERGQVLQGATVDDGADRQEGRADSDAPAGDGRGTQGVGRSVDTQPINNVSPPPRREKGPVRPFVRPYKLHRAKDAASALAFGEWFQEQRQEILGVAYQGSSLGFANDEEGWQVDLYQDPLVDDACRQALRILDTNDTPALVFEDAAATIHGFHKIMPGMEMKAILRLMHGDLQQLQRCTGRRIPKGDFPSPTDEAYSAFTSEQHWGQAAPQFYRTVALPQLAQEIHYPGRTEEFHIPWRISYSDLFLKVMAHATREPTMMGAFLEKKDPVPELANRLAVEMDQVIPIIFWTSVDFNAIWMQMKHPDLYAKLPEDLPNIRQVVEKRLSVLVLGVKQQREDYAASRRLETLYGRIILWGMDMSEALEERWLGSVQDLIDVAQVSCAAFWEDDPLPVAPTTEGLLERTIRVSGVAPNNQSEITLLLEGVAELNTPLSFPLNANVIWGD